MSQYQQTKIYISRSISSINQLRRMTDFFKNQPKLKEYSKYCSLGGLVLAILYFVITILYWQVPNDNNLRFIQNYLAYFFFCSFLIVGALQIGLLMTARRPIPSGKQLQFAKEELLLDILSVFFFSSTFIVACIFLTFYIKVIEDWDRVISQFKNYYDALFAQAILGIVLGAPISIINIKYRLLKMKRIIKGQQLPLMSEGQEGLRQEPKRQIIKDEINEQLIK